MCSEEPITVLIVEDHPAVRRLMEMSLLKAGYQTASACNGREGLELFLQDTYPIVLIDWMMPEMDGIELCRIIREHSSKSYVYIIFLTAKDTKEDVVCGLQAGADDYLIKPVNPAELLARLKTARRIIELERSLRRRNEEFAMLSVTDPLTGLYNRGYFNEHLVLEMQRTSRYGGALSLILCDIDHFKKVNDDMGHQAGDHVLKEFARRLRRSVRAGADWVVRYGGEEFAVVLPQTGLEGACEAAERYRRVVSQDTIQTDAGPTRITASFGVGTFEAPADCGRMTMDSLVKAADQCLYRAKHGGRNRVVGTTKEG